MSRSLSAYAARLAGTWRERFGDHASASLGGSLVKLDLSGFTQLSEQLALTRSTGAEDLNDLLNEVFGELIDIAQLRGGDVLQFGGDALVIWYEGDGHARRAAAATWLQQQAMRSRPVGDGQVRLDMSAGIASGKFHFFVIGTSHRELVVGGHATTRTVLLEHEAQRGEILADGATSLDLAESATEAAGENTWRIVSAPSDELWPLPIREDANADGFVPPEVRAVEEMGPPVGEHRRSTVAFIRLPHLDHAVLDGSAQSRLTMLTDAVEESRERYHVCWTATDVADDGVVFLLFAGAPVTREGDDERMLHACRHIVDRCTELALQVGVNSGRVFAADVGSRYRRTYAIIGDTTNLAARLMSRTAPCTVQVARQVIERAGPTHEVEWLEPFLVKGKRAPVQAALLGAALRSAGRSRIHDLPLVGREHEMSLIRECIERLARRDEPGSLALVGEPGAGKSRLIAEAERLGGDHHVTVLRAVGAEYEQHSPYAVVRDLLLSTLGTDLAQLRTLCRRVGMPDLDPLLALPLGIEIPPTPEGERLAPEFVEPRRNELLAALLEVGDAPTMLILDDAQLLDDATWGFVVALARRRAPAVSVLAAGRSLRDEQSTGSAGWQRIELGPLDHQAARDLVLAAAGDQPLTDEYLDRVIEEGRGTPLFLKELGRFPKQDAEELPESAEEVVAAHLDALAPPDLALLRDASVVGRIASLDVLATALHDTTLSSAARWNDLTEFVDFSPGRHVEFRSELYRRSAYAGLARRRRQSVHASVADSLLAVPASAPSLVALHLHEAGRYVEAFDWSARAAADARRQGAARDAAALYHRALDAARRGRVDDQDRILAVAVDASDVNEAVGRYAEANSALDLAVEQFGWTARLLIRRATVLERLGDLTGAHRFLRRAARHSAVSQEDIADRMLRESSVNSRSGRLRLAWEAAIGALDLARRLDDVGRTSLALLRLEMVGSELGEPDAEKYGVEAIEILRSLGDDRNLGHVLLNVGASAKDGDRWDEAARRYRESADAYGRAGDIVGRAFSINNLAEVLLDQGQLEQAQRQFTEARRIFRSADHRLGAAATASSLGTINARENRHEAARDLLAVARAEFRAMRSPLLEFDAVLRQVENEVLSGALDAAENHLGDARRMMVGIGDVHLGDLALERLDCVIGVARGDVDSSVHRLTDLLVVTRERQALFETAQMLFIYVAVAQGGASHREELARLQRHLGIATMPPLPRFEGLLHGR